MLMATSRISGQTDFVEVLEPDSLSWSTEETAQFTKIQQNETIEDYWVVSLNSIENYLDGNILEFTLPEDNQAYSFEADNVTSYTDGEYYWAGYNADGSSFRLRKGAEDFLGNIYIAPTDSYYGIISLSPYKTVLVQYDPEVIRSYDTPCENTNEEDDDSEDTVEDRGGCENNTIRVLFLFTAAAAALLPNPVTVSNLVISEANASSMESRLPETDVHFQSAGAVLLSGFIETFDIGDDLDDFSNSSTVHNLRDAYYADIVILLTRNAYTNVAGQAKRIAAKNANAYCIAELPAAATNFTATHEIGHIIGTRHQRCTTCWNAGCDILTDHHGYLVGNNFRTLMHQEGCGSGARVRIGRWSTPISPFMSFATGNLNNDNALKLFKRAGKVSCFRSTPPPSGGGTGNGLLISIDGANNIPNCQGYYPYLAVVAPPFVSPLTYKWEISPIGVGNWTQVSTSNSYVITNPSSWPNYWVTLRLTVTDANGAIGIAHKEIQRVNCVIDGGNEERESLSYQGSPSIYPNPINDVLTIENTSPGSIVTIFDTHGRIVRDFSVVKESENRQSLKLDRLQSGVYLLSLSDSNETFTYKFIKL
jgi:hypothetical protein